MFKVGSEAGSGKSNPDTKLIKKSDPEFSDPNTDFLSALILL
jgi:hypothetical protein